ncbi:hypothetical protein T265_01455 [Opisthorchis viverrini]|uniref:Uncharacterized protein n=1 Tax=Opisthorchis viverrini TaxID=6198 RepID=A0A074ZZS8_OPIVI|nr:hypothetical protein T265_01455 [Opisthorchis viverrini]KER32586.1 hypothetical protein T265_01455 [Opisthorchis viverrini]
MCAFVESEQFAPMRKLFGLFKQMMGKAYPVRTFVMDKKKLSTVAADIPADEAEAVKFVAPSKFMVDCVYAVAHVVLIVRQGSTFAGTMTA